MTYRLRLYITGRTSNSLRAIENLRMICESKLSGSYEVEVIDVLEHPRLAEDEKIMATPTLVKCLPEPTRKIIGDLSDRQKVLLGLDLVVDADERDLRQAEY
jgi:circadian clock protein KaiB